MEERRGLDARLSEAAERLVAEGRLPAWMERLTYDTARVSFGGPDEHVVVASPPKSATAPLRHAQGEVTRIAETARRPDDPAKAEELGKAMERLSDLTADAEVSFFTAAILSVGPGIRFRADIVAGKDVAFAAGEPIPPPRAVKDPERRKLLVTDGFPEFVLARVRDAVGFLAAQGIGAFLGNA